MIGRRGSDATTALRGKPRARWDTEQNCSHAVSLINLRTLTACVLIRSSRFEFSKVSKIAQRGRADMIVLWRMLQADLSHPKWSWCATRTEAISLGGQRKEAAN
jgi:hypothetical protein